MASELAEPHNKWLAGAPGFTREDVCEVRVADDKLPLKQQLEQEGDRTTGLYYGWTAWRGVAYGRSMSVGRRGSWGCIDRLFFASRYS